jgi:hypothetical protein
MMKFVILAMLLLGAPTLAGCAVAAFAGGAVVQHEWDIHH